MRWFGTLHWILMTKAEYPVKDSKDDAKARHAHDELYKQVLYRVLPCFFSYKTAITNDSELTDTEDGVLSYPSSRSLVLASCTSRHFCNAATSRVKGFRWSEEWHVRMWLLRTIRVSVMACTNFGFPHRNLCCHWRWSSDCVLSDFCVLSSCASETVSLVYHL